MVVEVSLPEEIKKLYFKTKFGAMPTNVSHFKINKEMNNNQIVTIDSI